MLRTLLLMALIGLAILLVRAALGRARSHRMKQYLRARLCRTFGHRRGGVFKIGETYHSRCRRCDLRLEKLERGGAWREHVPASAEAAADAQPQGSAISAI